MKHWISKIPVIFTLIFATYCSDGLKGGASSSLSGGQAPKITAANAEGVQTQSDTAVTFTSSDTETESGTLPGTLTTSGSNTNTNSSTASITNSNTASNSSTATQTYTQGSCQNGGKSIGGFCWYASVPGQSCDETCSNKNGVHSATKDYAGSNGTLQQCNTILNALGLPFSSTATTNVFNCNGFYGGFGCHYYHGPYQDTNPTVNNAKCDEAVRACACNR